MSAPAKNNGIQAELLQSLLEPLLDLLADKIAERMKAPTVVDPVEKENWLTPEQAAAILGVSKARVYWHAKKWNFAKRISHKALRVNEAGLRRWIQTRK